MDGNTWQRWAPASGILYAVVYVIGLVLLVWDDLDTNTDAELVSYFADSGNRIGHFVGFFLLSIGVLFLLLFVATLGNRLRSIEPEPKILSSLAFCAGASSAALLLGAGAALAATALAADDVDAFVVEPNSVRLTLSIGYMFLVDDVLNIDPFSSAIVYHGLAVPRKVSLLDLRHEGGRE